MLKKLLATAISSFALLIFVVNHSNVLAALPTNFEKIELLTSGLNNPTALEFAPDGRLFITEQGGSIKIYKNGELLSRSFDELPAFANSDRGLLGIAFDPEYQTNHYVYFYYIDNDSVHNIVRFNAVGDIATDGPVTIWKSGEATGSNHAGGTIQFGPDGKLYAGIGEGNFPQLVQSLNNYFGKIIRINKDGTVPSDNPHVGQENAKPEIWATGLRNPFRFQFDKQSGDLLLGDVGGEKWEEVNKITKAGNYGWPTQEGSCAGCNFINPIFSYSHPTPSYSITGGFVYRNDLFPPEFKGNYFYGDYAQGFIKRLTFNTDGGVANSLDFESSAGSVVDMKVGPEGAIYYVTIFPGKLVKINYSQGNKTPVAKASSNTKSGIEPLTVNFSSNGSFDPEGSTLTYVWDFGDESNSSEPNPVKTYSNPGAYSVTLTVSDGTITNKSAPLLIQVGTPPTIEFTNPANNSNYIAGQAINYLVTAKDKNNNDIPQDNVSFEVLFHHSTHIHPFIRPTASTAGQFLIPNTGEHSSDVWYELIATATDSNGVSTTKSVNIYPTKSTFSIKTVPSGLKVKLEGEPTDTPKTLTSVVGYKKQVDAYTQQVNGKVWEFDRWSDGGNKRHTITVDPSPTEYTAIFKESPPFIGQYFDNLTFSGQPLYTREDPIINFAWGDSSPGGGIPNNGFTIRWTKDQYFSYGKYKFSGFSDDGIRVYLDNQLILDAWSFNRGVSSELLVTEGTHNLRVDYREESGGADVGFSWDLTDDQPQDTSPTPSPTISPSVTPLPTTTATPISSATPSSTPTSSPTNSPISTPTNGVYNAEYFNNKNLLGDPVLTRFDEAINFVWNHASPDSGVNSDQFSVRWIGNKEFETGIYQFAATADDGVRLWIDDQLVIDKWHDQGATTYYHDHYVTEGTHTIKMEYYENFGGAVAKLDYKKLPSEFEAEFFDNKNLEGPAKLKRLDANVNYILGYTSIGFGIPIDNWSARWSKKQYFTKPQNYSFTIKSDDGIRLWVDGNLILEDWSDHAMKTYTPVVNLSEGIHYIQLEYYENQGSSVITFNQNN